MNTSEGDQPNTSAPIPAGIEQLPKAAVFTAVVRAGSFSRAASALGMARSTVSQHVAALEDALGVRLIERTTRQMRLTEEGELLHARMTTALDAWEDARSAFAERQHEPSGTVRVTAPGGLASTLVAAAGGQLLERFPQIRFELLADDRSLDLVGEGIDLAIRMAPLPDSSLVAKKLGTTPKILIASPSLAATLAGDGERPADVERALAEHGYVTHASVPHAAVELRCGPESFSVPVESRASANGAQAQLALVEAGAGIALMPELFTLESLAAKRVARVFPTVSGSDLPIFAVYPARRLIPTRVSSFLPILEARLREVAGS